MTNSSIVSLRGVRKRFEDVTAVDRVDLDVEEGEFLTLLGPSGSGKTTTLRLIGGFEAPDEGRIYLADQDITEVPSYLRPVNTVFQSYALFPHLSTFENVAFGLRILDLGKNEVEKRVQAELELVGLSQLRKRKPHQLSGGEMQRVALARALVLRPQVLLLDEPLGSLDLKLRQRMEVELKQIQRESRITFIYVTHDQSEALAMSDRVAIMRSGRVEQIGSSVEVYERPGTKFVAGFLGDANLLEGKVINWEGTRVLASVSGLGEVLGQSLAPQPAAANSHVTLVIRPEHITCVTEKSDGTPNHLSGTVGEVLMMGGLDRRVHVRLANGQVIQMLVRAGTLDVSPGDEVFLTWPAERAVVLEGR